MQLYKSRDFGLFFQDTFAFLRKNGGHLFKNYFIINGGFLLILMVLGYFFLKFYSEILFGGIDNNPSEVEQFINENAGTYLIFILVFLFVALAAGVTQYAFVPIYLKLYAKHDSKAFKASDIFDEYKRNIGKICIFLLCSILLIIPIGIVAFIISFILMITIIGMLMLPVVVGAVSLLFQSTLMEYIEGKKSIWDAFGYAWTVISSKFWAAIICVGLFFLMSYIVQNVVTLVPYFIFLGDLLMGIESGTNPDPEELTKSAMVLFALMFILTFVFSIVLNVIVQLNQGVVFYSLKEDIENINTKSDIDLIGTGE